LSAFLHQMRNWESDLLLRETQLANREAAILACEAQFATAAAITTTQLLLPSPSPAAAAAAAATVDAAAAANPSLLGESEVGGLSANSCGGGGSGENTLDMPDVTRIFDAERLALTQAFAGYDALVRGHFCVALKTRQEQGILGFYSASSS
jgi:hypothetical protein